ncbi:MAG: efflux RND transporter permease subunit, partial [Acidobacteria bacterium]|nr:efflux RND transporter permease subunit [Acidobacteriota bacterium]
PNEDQGAFFTSMRLPDGASTERADAAARKIETVTGSLPGVDKYFVLGGLDIATGTSNSNVATIIATLKPWDERTAPNEQLDAILGAAQRGFARVPEAFTFAFGLPPILGLSPTGGFQFMLEDRAGSDVATLARAADLVVNAARRRPELANVISTFRASVPTYSIDMDTDKLQTMGIGITDAYNTLQTFLGGLYVNDFNQFGHTWQVLLQAEPGFRNQPADIGRFYVRNSQGGMVPLSTLANVQPTGAPDVIYRYNRFRAIQILGGPAPGYSSGQASKAMEEVAAAVLPAGFGYEWTGTTYQEKQAQGNEGAIFGFAAVLVFLFLAALYESWSIPFAVLFALPLGMFGALLAVDMRAYAYDIYTQIGIVTLIGLAAKNAILIVEFARESHAQGRGIREAAIEAAHLRLRPILMTSFAFILGVVPLVIATGASSAARRSLGTAVFGGMITATLLAIFIVPVLYVVIEGLVERRRESAPGVDSVTESAQ